MRSTSIHRRPIAVGAVCAAAVALAALLFVMLRSHSMRGLPYHDSFATGQATEWTAFGGTWQIADGAMRNDSDERGAKLMTGSSNWKDYSFSTDVQLLGRQGDAGIVLRSSDEEQGVDAYHGYYIGLRSNDSHLIIGGADHRWIPLVEEPVPGGVHAFKWYRLKGVVQGCRITAYANELPRGAVQSISFTGEHCTPEGRIGLRSHSSGGAWRNLAVLPLSAADSQSASASPYVPPAAMPFAVDEPVTQHVSGSASAPNSEFEDNRGRADSSSAVPGPVESIGSLRMVRTQGRLATVHGTVILNYPRLYVQDAIGGVAVVPSSTPNLKVGDEVEVTGEVEVHDFSCTIRNATVRLLWGHSPPPPVAVTASQAATGAFDATFIEVDGSLESQTAGPNKTLILALKSGEQSFSAIVQPTRGSESLQRTTRQSVLRLRGVCVVDSRYTYNLTPFVLLVSSSDDVEVLAGPPWWSLHNLAIIGLMTLTLCLLAYLLYQRARHWRLHAIVEERERIAHDMHDTLAQSFVGIGFQLQAISNSVPPNLPNINQQLDLACELVRHSHEEATRSLSTLRREFLESESLHSALYAFARRMVEHGAVDVELDIRGDDTSTPYAVKDGFFRIGQEAIANALRHGNPSVLHIRVEYGAANVIMTIEDDGVGFEQTTNMRGFGLTGIRKRAEAISAAISISSAVGRGTCIRVTATLPPRLTWFKAKRYFRRDAEEEVSNGKGSNRQDPYSYRR